MAATPALMAWVMGRLPSVRPTRNTASHSRPLAAWRDARVTPCMVGGCLLVSRWWSWCRSPMRLRSGVALPSSLLSSTSAWRLCQRSRAWAPSGSWGVRPMGARADSTSSCMRGPMRSGGWCSSRCESRMSVLIAWRISGRLKNSSPPRTW